MPHAALWVVQQGIVMRMRKILIRFNAARGFVGGATWEDGKNPSKEYVFQCRTRLCGWCNLTTMTSWFVGWSFNAARGFVGGATFFAPSIS